MSPLHGRRSDDLIRPDGDGLWCDRGGFHVDPWRPVPLALVTHAHADHARPGSGEYLAAAPSVPILERRLGGERSGVPGSGRAKIRGLPFGERFRLGEVELSFHPAGHVLGSAQIRIEAGGETWVVSGDYKREADPSCEPFEVVPCDVFVTEATFALPVYRWPETARVAREILDWWRMNRRAGRASVVFCYALGKAQRLLAELARLTDRAVFAHGALVAPTEVYRRAGVEMPELRPVAEAADGTSFAGELVLAPPSARRSPWLRRFGDCRTAFASGWMRLRGARRRQAVDRGFVLSDHADWPGLLETVEETGARRVLTHHGYADALARYLGERGLDAAPLETGYAGEEE